VNQRNISVFAKAGQHPPYLAVGYFQPRSRLDLRQMLLLYLVQHFQSVPFSLARSDLLRVHGAPAIHESGHSHFAATDQADQAGALHKGKLRSKFSVGQGVKKKSLVEEVAL